MFLDSISVHAVSRSKKLGCFSVFSVPLVIHQNGCWHQDVRCWEVLECKGCDWQGWGTIILGTNTRNVSTLLQFPCWKEAPGESSNWEASLQGLGVCFLLACAAWASQRPWAQRIIQNQLLEKLDVEWSARNVGIAHKLFCSVNYLKLINSSMW